MPHARKQKRRRLDTEDPYSSQRFGREYQDEPYDVELRNMLSGLDIPPSVFRFIERRFLELKQQISDRIHHVTRMENQMNDYHSRLENQRKKAEHLEQLVAEKSRTLRQVRAEGEERTRSDAQRFVKLKRESKGLGETLLQRDQLLDAGRMAVSTMRDEIQGLKLQVQTQGAALQQKEALLNSLNDILTQMEDAPGNQMVALALEAQAQQTLGLVNGLKGDIAGRDKIISDLKAMLRERDSQLQIQVESITSLEADKKIQTKKNLGLKNELRATVGHSAKSQNLLGEQQAFIEELLEENSKLQSLAGGRPQTPLV